MIETSRTKTWPSGSRALKYTVNVNQLGIRKGELVLNGGFFGLLRTEHVQKAKNVEKVKPHLMTT
jgi:hypothetical protein